MELKTLHGLVIGTKSNITNSLISHKKINKKNLPIRDENSTKKKRSQQEEAKARLLIMNIC